MEDPLSTRTIGRTLVVGGYAVVLAVAGRPVWAAVLLGIALALVWAAPLVLNPTRHRGPVVAPVLPVAEPKEAGPS
jgi:hypothetical protein